MELYKLFYLIHRRTDWKELYRWQRETILPEWYEESRRQADLMIQNVALLNLGIRGALGGLSYFLE